MDIILRIAVIGVIVTLVVSVLKQSNRDDIATLAAIAGMIAVGLIVLKLVVELFTSIQSIFSLYG